MREAGQIHDQQCCDWTDYGQAHPRHVNDNEMVAIFAFIFFAGLTFAPSSHLSHFRPGFWCFSYTTMRETSPTASSSP